MRIEVVAGVLRDRDGRVLLAQRPPGKELAGLWEFPGGKCRPGEGAPVALARELREELGIEASIGERLLRTCHATNARTLVLDTWQVQRWQGELRGLEGQALVWVPPAELSNWPMPAPDRPVQTVLRVAPHYVISAEPPLDAPDRFLAEFESLLQRQQARVAAEEWMRRGLVQLRSKHLDDARLKTLARRCQDLAEAHGIDLLLNGRPALAAELGLGLHLTASQLRDPDPIAILRDRSPDRWLAASCHNAAEIQLAAEAGCDFVTVSPVQPTASHPGAACLDWSGLAALTAASPLPCFALGGLQPNQLDLAREHGAFGIAGIRAF